MSRSCFSSFETLECISANDYIDILINASPLLAEVFTNERGVACFCNEDLCNSEIDFPTGTLSYYHKRIGA